MAEKAKTKRVLARTQRSTRLAGMDDQFNAEMMELADEIGYAIPYGASSVESVLNNPSNYNLKPAQANRFKALYRAWEKRNGLPERITVPA